MATRPPGMTFQEMHSLPSPLAVELLRSVALSTARVRTRGCGPRNVVVVRNNDKANLVRSCDSPCLK